MLKKMKLKDFNLSSVCLVAAVLVGLILPSIPQNNTLGNEFPSLVESTDQDFVVKFKSEIFSWKNFSQLLRQHNITLPHESDILTAVLVQKNSSAQSCKGRCFMDERADILDSKTCFCDKACIKFRDCCLDFYSRCDDSGNVVDNTSFHDMICGNVNHLSRSTGVIMKSSCSLHDHQSTTDCQAVNHLSMTLLKELPVFDLTQNVTYRSIACARCNSGKNLSYWGLRISCKMRNNTAFATPGTITEAQRFLKAHRHCSWKYSPLDLKQYHNSCVLHDTHCTSNQLPTMSLVKELCYAYSMAFSVTVRWPYRLLTYRNPHCALCNPKDKSDRLSDPGDSSVPPLSILLDVSSDILNQEERENSQTELISENATQNLTSQLINCSSTNCTVTFGGQICEVFTSLQNISTRRRSSIHKSRVMMRQKKNLFDNNSTDVQGNNVYIVCPKNRAGTGDKNHRSTFLSFITLVGALLSIISLCFLLSVYISFKELRNLPGKCLINLCLALLCFQAIFLGAAKSSEVDSLCKAVAIVLHFFILAAFSWMSVMAFDSANTFTLRVRNAKRQPSDTKKTFVKYCIVGWGLPSVAVVLCTVLDFTGALHFGYGKSTYCWISGKTAIAVAVVTPVSFALVFNIVCLVKNAFAIRRVQQSASLAANNSSRPSLTLVCIKLTAVMGITWILALIANWKQISFLLYPSTMLNSMQGFFITLCFTTTKKVRSLLKQRFYKRSNGTAEPQRNVTRDRCTRNTGNEIGSGSNKFNVNYVSRKQERQSSS